MPLLPNGCPTKIGKDKTDEGTNILGSSPRRRLFSASISDQFITVRRVVNAGATRKHRSFRDQIVPAFGG